MFANKPKRMPAGSVILLFIATALLVRSLYKCDTVARDYLVSETGALIEVRSGVSLAHAGISFFRETRMSAAPDLRAARQIVEANLPGWHWTSDDLSDDVSLLRRFGMGWRSEHDEQPRSLREGVELTIPLWLLMTVFAIAPARHVWTRRRERAAALAGAADRADHANEVDESGRTRGGMRIGIVIGLLAGVLIGAGVALVLTRHNNPQTTAVAASSPSVAPGANLATMPIHPIVGTWRINIAPPIAATYRFNNDGSFALSFSGIPAGWLQNRAVHETTGTWKVTDGVLQMHNTTSTTGLTVPGEDESARIVSIDANRLVLDNTDRKGRPERLTLERYMPFIVGRYDNADLIGTWLGPQRLGNAPPNLLDPSPYTIELKSNGDATLATRRGKWMQYAGTMRILLDPLPVRSAARRASNPQLGQPSEQMYSLSLSADANSLTLMRTDLERALRHVFARTTSSQPAEEKAQRK